MQDSFEAILSDRLWLHVFQTCIPLFLGGSLWSRLYLPYLPCFSDMYTTFFGWLSLEQALSTLSTMFFRHAYHFFCLALFGAGSIYPIYHVFRTCIPLFWLALFGAGSIYPIYHVFQTCIPLFLACSLWSRLYLPYLPWIQDIDILLLCWDL